MDTFYISIVDRKPVRTAGIMVATSMETASSDCPSLWRTFGPYMAGFPADPANPEQSYGVSIMDGESESTFTYWAVMPLRDGSTVPDGMQALTIPGGLFASCEVESLSQLGAAYNYIYLDWSKSQSAYRVDMTGPCLEIYRKNFLATGGLTVQCPLVTA